MRIAQSRRDYGTTNVAIDAVNVLAKILNRQRQQQRHHRPTASKCGFVFRAPKSPSARTSLALPNNSTDTDTDTDTLRTTKQTLLLLLQA